MSRPRKHKKRSKNKAVLMERIAGGADIAVYVGDTCRRTHTNQCATRRVMESIKEKPQSL
jgi:hypothetical protein